MLNTNISLDSLRILKMQRCPLKKASKINPTYQPLRPIFRTHVVRFHSTAGCSRRECAVSHFGRLEAVSAPAIAICLNSLYSISFGGLRDSFNVSPWYFGLIRSRTKYKSWFDQSHLICAVPHFGGWKPYQHQPKRFS